jgi:RNA polymerase sigma-70 factor (ECF subfamily)
MSEHTSLLLERLRAGDAAARNDLIHHCRNRLRLLTRQMLRRFPGVRQWEETSDVLQKVLVRLDRALQTVHFETPRDFLRLATTQIRRELIDLVRHLYGPNGLGANVVAPGQGNDGVAPPDPSDGTADPYHLAQWHDLHCQIAALDEDQRELWELCYYQGMTQVEAADVLAVSHTTFKRRWQKARLQLRKRLGGDFPC